MRIGVFVRRAIIAVALIVLVVAVAVYVLSQRRLTAVYPVPATRVGVPQDLEAAARGEHLVRVVGSCTLCHSDDLGGGVYADMGLIGRVAGPNLTRGHGGVGATFTVDDWVRAIRYGVRRDGTSLIMMPSEVFTNFTDADLGSIVAFLLRLPPVDREMPPTRFGPLGRALLAIGKLNILTAPKTHHSASGVDVRVEESAAYGRYLADVSGCHGCHGFGLSGGQVAGPPGLPPAANLTPTGLGAWSQADFTRAMREGRRPDGREINEFMPWRKFAGFTDAELNALWLYLQSVPPKAAGNK